MRDVGPGGVGGGVSRGLPISAREFGLCFEGSILVGVGVLGILRDVHCGEDLWLVGVFRQWIGERVGVWCEWREMDEGDGERDEDGVESYRRQ